MPDAKGKEKLFHGCPLELKCDISIRFESDERQACLLVNFAMEMGRRLDEHHLKDWPDMPFDQMAAMGRPVGLADYDVGMEFRISIIKNNVPHEGENLNLLLNGDFVIRLFRPIEVTQCHVGKGPNRGEVAGVNLLLTREGEQIPYHFVPVVKNNCVSLFSQLVYQLCFHGNLIDDAVSK